MLLRSAALVTLLSFGCDTAAELSPEESLIESCAGEVIPQCRPHEYAIVREGSVTPAAVVVGDPLARIDVRIVFDSCPDAPQTHTIALTAFDATSGGARMVTLQTFRDGGPEDDDPATGMIEANVENFFLTDLVREETDLLLTFEPRIDVCRGGGFELEYRTGPAYERP